MFEAIRFHSRLNPELPGLVAFDSAARELSYADIATRVDSTTHPFAIKSNGALRSGDRFHSALAGSFTRDGALILPR